MNEYLYLKPDQLQLHPKNMRVYYRDEDIEEMAGSIAAAGGVLQAMLVCKADEPDLYWVVDGNIRLAGARRLGADCPALKCEVLEVSAAEQLLIMAVTSKFHYPKNPIEEALHFRRLMEEEGYSVRQVAEATGVSDTKIGGVIRWLDLDKEIQDMVATGRLPRDRRVAEALLRIDQSEVRSKLARRFVASRTRIDQIERDCARMADLLKAKAELPAAQPVRAKLMVKKANKIQPFDYRPKHRLDATSAETILNLAEEFCGPCSAAELTAKCATCDGVIEFVNKLVGLALEAREIAEVAA